MFRSSQYFQAFSSPTEIPSLAEQTMMAASAAQFPSEIGSKAADVIYRLLAGEEVEKNILVPVELITEENVDAFGIDRWQ